MKTVSQMMSECGCKYDDVDGIIKTLNLSPDQYDGRFRYYGQLKEDLIYKTLYFIGKCDMVTFESKMNIPEPEPKKETFNEFKQRTYTRYDTETKIN